MLWPSPQHWVTSQAPHWTKVHHHLITRLSCRQRGDTSHPPASLTQGWFRATEVTASGSLRSFTSQTKHPTSDKRRLTTLPGPQQHARQSNVTQRGSWFTAAKGLQSSCGSQQPRWLIYYFMTCFSIYLFHLNFCKFLDMSAISQRNWEQKRGNKMVLSEMK